MIHRCRGKADSDVATGVAQVLRNDVASNTMPFTITGVQLTSISPGSGSVGTSVTFNGSGFGASQGSGLHGSTVPGQVVSWSDSQVVATVAPGGGFEYGFGPIAWEPATASAWRQALGTGFHR